jgi:chemotaxis protein CheX
MDVKFLNPFVHGTVEAMKKIAAIDIRPGKVSLKGSNVAAGDVSGIIGITGDATGTLAISFTETCICNIVSVLRGEPHPAADREVFAFVREITKMVFSSAGASIEQEGLKVYASLPAVVYGKNHTLEPMPESPSITIPFSTDGETFFVDICIKSLAADASQATVARATKRQIPDSLVKTAGTDLKPAPNKPSAGDGSEIGPQPTEMDRKALLMKQLTDAKAARDGLLKQLAEKPFMEMSLRTKYKLMIPALEAKIKSLKSDITATETMAKVNLGSLEDPVIPTHYQHYDNKKR